MTTNPRLAKTDKSGCSFELSRCGLNDEACLNSMYEKFNPRAVSQGLPPRNDQACRTWISGLMDKGENFLAWVDDQVVGHAALMPGPDDQRAEFIIFVLQAFRNRGLGTELTRLALERAKEMGLKEVWLTVEAFNFRAINLYRKVGFEFLDAGERERTMAKKI